MSVTLALAGRAQVYSKNSLMRRMYSANSFNYRENRIWNASAWFLSISLMLDPSPITILTGQESVYHLRGRLRVSFAEDLILSSSEMCLRGSFPWLKAP